jgi:hypothetical protein
MVDNVIVESEEVSGDLKLVEASILEAGAARATAGAAKKVNDGKAPKEEDSEDADLPENLRGKSRKEIAEYYVNLRSEYGRMANDLGTQRKLTDKLLDLKRETDLGNNGRPSKKVEINSSELLENPTAAIEKVVTAHTAQDREERAAMAARAEEEKFVAAHPDYATIGSSAEFAAWVQASPIRQRAAFGASQGDYSLAADLLTEFKATNKPSKKTADVDEEARRQAANAGLESTSQSNSGTKKSGKIYKRSDLMLIRATRPDVWDDPDFQNEVLLAYAEKRVK